MSAQPEEVELAIEKYTVTNEPYYLPVRNEVEIFEAAYRARLPVMMKGPTGCGKTRFIEYMAWRLGRPLVPVRHSPLPGGFSMSAAPSDSARRSTIRRSSATWASSAARRPGVLGAPWAGPADGCSPASVPVSGDG